MLLLPEPADPDKIAKARDALHTALNQSPSGMPAGNPYVGSQPPSAPKRIKPPAELTPLPPPPLPISEDKQRRLADLLAKYQADTITPEQYHQQRAKILAEP